MSNAITLESLGIAKEEIIERVVSRAVEQLLAENAYDEDGDEHAMPSKFATLMKKRIMERVDRAIDEIAGRNVLPNVTAYVENLVLQETNKWGEKQGKTLTFTEYLVARAEAYITEHVNYEGKNQAENGSYSWSKHTTRIAYLVNKHLNYTISSSVESALKAANSKIAGGIEGAVKIALEQALSKLRVKTETS